MAEVGGSSSTCLMWGGWRLGWPVRWQAGGEWGAGVEAVLGTCYVRRMVAGQDRQARRMGAEAVSVELQQLCGEHLAMGVTQREVFDALAHVLLASCVQAATAAVIGTCVDGRQERREDRGSGAQPDGSAEEMEGPVKEAGLGVASAVQRWR